MRGSILPFFLRVQPPFQRFWFSQSFGIADAGLGLDIVEPGVFHAFAAGPHVLAGDGAGVAADALVEVQHHRDLRADFHSAVSIWRSAGFGLLGIRLSSQSTFDILRMMTNSSRLVPTVP